MKLDHHISISRVENEHGHRDWVGFNLRRPTLRTLKEPSGRTMRPLRNVMDPSCLLRVAEVLDRRWNGGGVRDAAPDIRA